MDEMYNNPNGQNENSYQNTQYQQPQPSIQAQLHYEYQTQENLEEPITMGEWLITMLIMLIPCVNIVMMFVWAFSSTEKKSKSNYFKANLIFMGIMFVFTIVMVIVVSVAAASAIENLGGYYYY